MSGKSDGPRADLADGVEAVRAIRDNPPGGWLSGAIREMKSPTISPEMLEWRERLTAAQKQVVPAVDACLASGMTLDDAGQLLAAIGAEIKPNGRNLMVSFAGSGWFLETKPVPA